MIHRKGTTRERKDKAVTPPLGIIGPTNMRALKTIHRCPECDQWVCAPAYQKKPHKCAWEEAENGKTA